jgi:hypothetical protein
VDEVHVLQVLVFVQENVEDPNRMACLADPIREPAADVSGTADDEDVGHFGQDIAPNDDGPGRLASAISSIPR